MNGLDEMRDWKVLVIGLGMTGRSAAAFCAERGARVVAVDERPLTSFDDAEAIETLKTLGRDVEIRMGSGLPPSSDFDLVVPSPGVPRARYNEGARRVWGDIELTGRALQVPVVAVTGTNGKSTTVRLIESMLRATGLRARAAGNIGAPALALIGEPLDVAVIEVSSFQLEAVDRFRPKVAVILNATPDHLDRHGSFEAYVEAKASVLARQEPDDVAVLNFDDPVVRDLASRTRARVIPVSRTTPFAEGVMLDTGRVLLIDGRGRIEIDVDWNALPALRGLHNLENVLAALATVWGLGADPRRAAAALLDFEGLPHRCQEVAEGGGVTFIDDSKATNAGAAQRSLESFGRPILWIAGGRGKGAGLEALAAVAADRAREAFLIGESAGEIEAALAGRIPTARCDSIDEAVAAAGRAARSGDVVLLAPACASFDQFRSFEERGERFAQAARRWTRSTQAGSAGVALDEGGSA
jgi:UDP-N-acetylmuramoylalanine--D-glutamate ligase